MKELHIAMIHDLVCSWCPIGYNNIKASINNNVLILGSNLVVFFKNALSKLADEPDA